MKNIGILVLFLFSLSGISSEKYIDEISWGSFIDLKNDKVQIKASSKYRRALICDKIGLEVELFSPISNTVVSRNYVKLENFFLYPEYNERKTIISLNQADLVGVRSENEKLIISDARLDLKNLKCKLATFHNYCDHALLNELEIKSISSLMDLLKMNSCHSISSKLWKKRKLNLTNSKIMSYEFLSLMPKLKTVWLEGSYQDQSKTLDHLKTIKMIGANLMTPYSEDNSQGTTQDTPSLVNSTSPDLSSLLDIDLRILERNLTRPRIIITPRGAPWNRPGINFSIERRQ